MWSSHLTEVHRKRKIHCARIIAKAKETADGRRMGSKVNKSTIIHWISGLIGNTIGEKTVPKLVEGE